MMLRPGLPGRAGGASAIRCVSGWRPWTADDSGTMDRFGSGQGIVACHTSARKTRPRRTRATTKPMPAVEIVPRAAVVEMIVAISSSARMLT